MKSFTLLVLFSALVLRVSAQEDRDKFPSYFGLIVAPVIPSNFLGNKTTSFRDTAQQMTTTFDQRTGLMFGASVRLGLARRFSIETGITQIRRNFNVKHSLPSEGLEAEKNFSFVSYDIPINGLVYIQLGEGVFMNAALGISVSHYPSDIRDTIRQGVFQYVQEGRRTASTYFALNAGLGFEYRVPKVGTFYLGASGKVPLKPIMFGVGIINNVDSGAKVSAYAPVEGNFFSIDLRYYLPNIRNKGPQFRGGPVEQ